MVQIKHRRRAEVRESERKRTERKMMMKTLRDRWQGEEDRCVVCGMGE